MLDTYLTMTQIGLLYGKTSHEVGHKLKKRRLRTENGKPSRKAHRNEFVARQFAKDKTGIYLWVWHQEKTCAILDKEAGWERI